MRSLRVGFVIGSDRWWRKRALSAKYFKMRLKGAIYPDVYSLPYFFADRFDLIRDGTSVSPGEYDLILSELNGTEGQLQYLDSLVSAGDPPVAVLPGPPEILASVLNHKTLILVKHILRSATHVWAFSNAVKSFCDGLVGMRRAEVIPWPFDWTTTRQLGHHGKPKDAARFRILIEVPLRFSGITQNYPFVVKAILTDILAEIPPNVRQRVALHTFVYTEDDKEKYLASGFADGLPIQLEKRRGYIAFVRFIGGCDAVINLTAAGILGRITFIAGALEKPGIFSNNAEINRVLYPGSTLSIVDTKGLRDALRRLLFGIADGRVDGRFLPSTAAAMRIGDFASNAAKMRGLLECRSSPLMGNETA